MTTPQREPASPCTKICTLDPRTDICIGCYRTLNEIAGWSKYTAEQKWDVLGKLEARKGERLARAENKNTSA